MPTSKARTNKATPVVPIQLDKPRHLRLDLNAMAEFEEVTGKSLINGQLENPTIKEIITLLWACLLHEDETLTIKQVGSWINHATYKDIEASLDEALKAATPEVTKTSPLARTSQLQK